MKSPQEIVDLLIQSEEEARRQIWLIPSENIPSPFSRLALATSAVNRYFFKHEYRGKRFCPGSEIYQELYDYCVEMLKKIFRARYVSLRPISGMNTMTMVITNYTEQGQLMFSISPDYGGHTHTDKIAEGLGRKIHHVPVIRDDDWFGIDYDALERDMKKLNPVLLYIDPMSVMYEFDVPRIRALTPENCALHYDTSHIMSFVAGNVFPQPLDEGYTSMGGSTHKTLPGPQKGFFATNSKEHFDRFEEFAGQQLSSLHASSVLGLAVTLAETVDFYEKYSNQTIANARFCLGLLEEAGFKVFGYRERKTDCHVAFIDTEPHCEAVEASYRLCEANIIAHPIMLPFLKPDNKVMRLGFQEATVLGMGIAEMQILADVFRRVLIEKEDPAESARTIADLRKEFSWPTSSCLDDERLNRFFEVLFK